MKYYIFYRENNNFEDILKDTNLRKLVKFKIKFDKHIIIGGDNIPEDLQSYIMLKYGDDIKDKNHIFIDRNPKPSIDYYPDFNRPKKFKNL